MATTKSQATGSSKARQRESSLPAELFTVVLTAKRQQSDSAKEQQEDLLTPGLHMSQKFAQPLVPISLPTVSYSKQYDIV